MESLFINSSGEDVVPTWSIRSNTIFCTLLGLPNEIPDKATDYIESHPLLLGPNVPSNVLQDLPFTFKAVWFNPPEHWLGWSPFGPLVLAIEDPVRFLWSSAPVPLVEEYTDIANNSDDGHMDSVVAGFFIHNSWALPALDVGNRLKSICFALASASDTYGQRFETGQMGDLPMPLDETLLTHIHASRKDANDAAERVKRSITSSLGFVSWFLSTKKLSASGLSSEDRNYVEALHLDARPKTGILLAHGVPVHYAWTEAEKMDGRFRRHSPDYWNEYSILSQDCAKADKEMKEEDLPSYSAWKEDLDRYDLLFQNLKAGKVGAELTEFKPHWEYRIVDFDLYGARTLLNTPIGVVCTFFRQNPIRVDEPAFDREWREHTHELSDFAPSERGEDISEGDAFYESLIPWRTCIAYPRQDYRS